jgi:hypothetical protein
MAFPGFHTFSGSSLRCYECADCGDPFSSDDAKERTCSDTELFCAKIDVNNGGMCSYNTETSALVRKLAARTN